MTAGLMPEELREPFHLRFGRRQQFAFDASVQAMRLIYPRLPPRFRQVPAYSNALRRLRGETGPDPIGAWLEKVLLDTKFGLPG